MNRHLAASILVAVLAWPATPARAEVHTLKMGVTPSCPYGLAA